MTTAGGALIGFKYGGPLGAADGAGAGRYRRHRSPQPRVPRRKLILAGENCSVCN
jgi:hypothetical protein